jgi:hypothetical protein
VLNTAANIATALTLVIAAVALWLEHHRITRARDEEVFNKVSDDYLDFLQLCLDHPDLGIFEPEEPSQAEIQPTNERLIMYEILLNVIERAFVLYRADLPADSRVATEFRKRQWAGWDIWVRRWIRDPNFFGALTALRDIGEFDTEFARYLHDATGSERPSANGGSAQSTEAH